MAEVGIPPRSSFASRNPRTSFGAEILGLKTKSSRASIRETGMDIALGVGGDDEGLWTVDQAAEFLKLKPYTVRVWVRRGMPAIKIGGRIRFIPDELKKWLKRFRS